MPLWALIGQNDLYSPTKSPVLTNRLNDLFIPPVKVFKTEHSGVPGGTVVKRHKYNAKRTMVDNIVFASAREAKRYGELKLLFHARQIQNLELQPKFPLHVGEIHLGEYRADFAYLDGDTRVVEDVKGFKTPLYRWKKKHVEAQYKVQVREV